MRDGIVFGSVIIGVFVFVGVLLSSVGYPLLHSLKTTVRVPVDIDLARLGPLGTCECVCRDDTHGILCPHPIPPPPNNTCSEERIFYVTQRVCSNLEKTGTCGGYYEGGKDPINGYYRCFWDALPPAHIDIQ